MDVRAIVTDPAELAKGVRVLDEGGLANLARHGERLYADAAGMMPSPYKVMVSLGTKVSARCTCMAARTRPFCKHAAALLVAWARAPEAFAESDRAPITADAPRRRAVKKGKRDTAALMADGVARAIALVRELAITGVASTGEGRADALRGLAEALRAGGLRRLAGRVHRLAILIDADDLDAEGFADAIADTLLTARKIEKHLAGEALDPRHVEELIGKTWRKADRAPVDGLELIEIATRVETTPDAFVVREQRFVDAATGVHYAEKQIVPAFLARRTAPKPSLAGQVARGAAGSMYPGYPPRRVDLETRGAVRELDSETLERLVAAALPGAEAALAAFQEHRKDVFAPDALPVTVRVDAIVADGRLRAVGPDGAALYLPAAPALEDQLAAALRGAELRAIVGDLALERALPVLAPLAVVIAVDGRHALRMISRAATVEAPQPPGGVAAVRLAEVRGEVADLLAQGVGSFTGRAVEAPVGRLRELGLDRPAQLLAGIAAKPEGERLEDIVRVHQVLGIALLRVVGTSRVEGETVPVPLCESVRVPAALDGADRWTATVRGGRALDEVPAATLVDEIHPWWSNGWLSPLVTARLAAEAAVRDRAAEQARAVLADRRAGRAARQTAIRILVALGERPRVAQDGPLEAFAHWLVADDADRRHRDVVAQDWIGLLRHGGAADDRKRAALALGELADDLGAAALRLAWYGDPVADVREAAAIALARRGDPAAVDGFVAALDARGDEARAAAIALGQSGDSRGARALVDALAAGWKPVLVGDSLRQAGGAVIPALRAAVAAQPALGKRKVVKELLAPP